jgi:S-adenosylmethionine hydrolase
VAVIGSTGFLEIAVNGGNAAKKLGFNIGTVVSVEAGRGKS